MKPQRLSEETIKQLPVPAKGNSVVYFVGAVIQGAKAPRGFGVRVTASGARAFILNYRIRGREYRYTIGAWPDWSPLRAVREARIQRQRIDRGENPLDDRKPIPKTKTVTDVLDEFVTRYVRSSERPLRSADHIESAFNRLVKPRIGKHGIYDLRRSHIAEMLDWIETQVGPVMADRTRAYLRKALTWHAERDDQFNVTAAVVRVASRANSKERARTRVLSDDEIRLIWPLLGTMGTFGAMVKMLLLTAQRRDEVARMSRKGNRIRRNLDNSRRTLQNQTPEPYPALTGRARISTGPAGAQWLRIRLPLAIENAFLRLREEQGQA